MVPHIHVIGRFAIMNFNRDADVHVSHRTNADYSWPNGEQSINRGWGPRFGEIAKVLIVILQIELKVVCEKREIAMDDSHGVQPISSF